MKNSLLIIDIIEVKKITFATYFKSKLQWGWILWSIEAMVEIKQNIGPGVCVKIVGSFL